MKTLMLFFLVDLSSINTLCYLKIEQRPSYADLLSPIFKTIMGTANLIKELAMQYHNLVFKFLIQSILLLSFVLITSPLHAADESDVIAGQKIAKKRCGHCHAIGLKGKSRYKKAPRFVDIVSKWPVDSLAESLAEGIVVGHKAMPEFKFEPEQLGQLLAYLSSLLDTNDIDKKSSDQ